MLLFYVQNVWFPDWASVVLFAAITTSLHETAAVALTPGYSGIYKLFNIRGLTISLLLSANVFTRP